MGKLIEVESGSVRPSQNFLKRNTVAFIISCYKNNLIDELPPTPIVRQDPGDGSLVAIDGHNLLAVNYLLQKPTTVYLAENEMDFLEGENSSITKRNEDLKLKFNKVLEIASSLKQNGIVTIKDLCLFTGTDKLQI